MDEVTYFDRISGFLKSTNPNPTGVYLFTMGRPGWPDSEGADATVANDPTLTVPVAWLGPQAPVAGRAYLLHPCGNRYVAGSGKPAVVKPPGAVIAGCQCTSIPLTLSMVPTDPTLNGGMFQPATLQWGLTPTDYDRLALGTNCFLSTQSFIDQIGESFRYFFNCTNDKFTLTRVYAHSIFGNPYRDTVRYTWPLSLAGNTCDPLLLTSGQIYQGGDTRTQIIVRPV
jgi:hypothetical protein